MIYHDATMLIGKTPIVRLDRFAKSMGVSGQILAKLENYNPGGSIKDRVALAMVEDAEKSGKLKAGGYVIEPTSGNTGIGLAVVCAIKGYHLILTMPSSMSEERKKSLRALGAELVLTDPAKGMAGAIEKANEICNEKQNSVILGQFDNAVNPQAHRETTAREILEDVGDNLDAFIAGVGTGGTLTGIGEVLKKEIKGVKVVAVEPYNSPMLSKGVSGAHNLQGIGANFIPAVLNREIIDEISSIKEEDAYASARVLGKTEGITCGISGGAALKSAVEFLQKNPDKRVLVILPDGGDRYLSTELYK